MRARVFVELEAKGLDPPALASAHASGHLTLGYLESAGRRHPRTDRTFAQLSEHIGVPIETLQNMYVTLGLPRPREDEHVREDDEPILKALSVLFGAGVGEGDVLRAVRIWGDSARRVAQFQAHYFHNTIEEPFRRRGLRDNEAFEAALNEVGLRMGHSTEEMLSWLFRRHAEIFSTEHQFEHVETALEEAGVRQRAPHGESRPQRSPISPAIRGSPRRPGTTKLREWQSVLRSWSTRSPPTTRRRGEDARGWCPFPLPRPGQRSARLAGNR